VPACCRGVHTCYGGGWWKQLLHRRGHGVPQVLTRVLQGIRDCQRPVLHGPLHTCCGRGSTRSATLNRQVPTHSAALSPL
jgi:hypothetical protein